MQRDFKGDGISRCGKISKKYGRFAYCTTSDERAIIAKALIGVSFDFGTTKKELRMSPIKEISEQNMLNIRYDSVSGITRNTGVFMLYHNYRAYPSYNIAYYKSNILQDLCQHNIKIMSNNYKPFR